MVDFPAFRTVGMLNLHRVYRTVTFRTLRWGRSSAFGFERAAKTGKGRGAEDGACDRASRKGRLPCIARGGESECRAVVEAKARRSGFRCVAFRRAGAPVGRKMRHNRRERTEGRRAARTCDARSGAACERKDRAWNTKWHGSATIRLTSRRLSGLPPTTSISSARTKPSASAPPRRSHRPRRAATAISPRRCARGARSKRATRCGRSRMARRSSWRISARGRLPRA